MVSTLFTECQNSTPFRRYDQFNFRGFDFYIGKRGVIFGDFFTIFAYKIFNIDVENTKIVTKMQTIDIITKKWHFLSKFAQFWPKFSKNFNFKFFFVIISMVCIVVTILVFSTSILMILWAKIVKNHQK